MFSSTSKLAEMCLKLGQEKPDLSEDEISRHLAKIIVGQKILDDDAFELGREAYNRGVEVVS